MIKKIIAFLFVVFFICGSAFADVQQIKLMWQHDKPPDLAGFKIYMQSEATVPGCPGTPNQANEIIDLPYTPGDPLTSDYQLTGVENETFHFVVTAYDQSNESECSEEATYKMPDIPIGSPFSVIIEVVIPTTTTIP